MSFTIRVTKDSMDLFQQKGPEWQNKRAINVSGFNEKGKNTDEMVDDKKTSARNQAMRLVKSAMKKDEMNAKSMENANEIKAHKAEVLRDLSSKRDDVIESKESYRGAYNIDLNSDEQKTLELLAKYQDNKYGTASDKFSAEEIEQLKEFNSNSITDYQKSVLEKNRSKTEIDKEIQKIKSELVSITGAIADGKINESKNVGMKNAEETAKALIDAADSEALGLIVQASKNAIDRRADEDRKQAEEIAEQRAERQERVEEAREERKEQRDLIEGVAVADEIEQSMQLQKNTDVKLSDVQKGIKKIMNDNNLINEDIKGIEIDLNF